MRLVKRYTIHLLVALSIAVSILSGASNEVSKILMDARFEWFQRAATGEVTLIAIDARSIREVGVWPWPRTLHADLTKKLHAAGAADIAFDIDFSSHSTPEADAAFANALRDANGSVMLPSFQQHAQDRNGARLLAMTQPLPEFQAHSWPVTANFQTDRDGIARHYPLGSTVNGTFIPSMSSMLAGVYDPASSAFTIDFSINPDTLPQIPFVDVMTGHVPAEKIAGKKIIVGATAVELGDRVNIPNGRIIPGPVFQALAAETLLQDRALIHTGPAATIAGLALLMLLVAVLWHRLTRAQLALFLIIVSAIVETMATVLQVKSGILLNTSLWQVAIAAYLSAVGLAEFDFRGLMARIAESRFRRIALSMGDGLVCTDDDGRIQVWNPGATKIFGFDDSQMLGMPFATVIAAEGDDEAKDLASFFTNEAEDATSVVVELAGRRKSGECFPLEICLSRWKSTTGHDYGLLLRDITVRKREEDRIRFLAGHDTLTGLANRAKINDELVRAILTADERNGELAVILLGLDKFKELNDTLGQDRGDIVIRAVAAKLLTATTHIGAVARVSGDEFAVVLEAVGDNRTATDLVADLASEFKSLSVDLDARTVTVSMSLGSAIYPRDGKTVGDLMANAALALQDAKLHNRGGHVPYRAEIRSAIEDKRQLEKDLYLAFERSEFELYYQPQVRLIDRQVVGAEALIRWNHPTLGMIPPGRFMPILNGLPLATDVGGWVISEAFQQAGTWHAAGHDIRIGVNLSPAQLKSENALPEFVAKEIAKNALPLGLIELEVTENILLDDDAAAHTIRRIRDMGVVIAFDDFGTGYASLTHLKRLPLDRLKIDQTFVRTLLTDQEDRAIVGAIIGLGRLLKMHLISEGVEDLATADALLEMGCEEAQGYAFGRPVPASQFYATHLANRGRPGKLRNVEPRAAVA